MLKKVKLEGSFEGIELRGISYRYPHREQDSLYEINCRIGKGRMIAVLGAGGSGKSTLALMLNGLIPQFMEGDLRGSMLLDGQDTGEYSVPTLAHHVGLVFQDGEAQIFSRQVGADVAFGPRNYGFSPQETEERVQTALAAAGLAGMEERNTAELSGGEKQRLAVAGILAIAPEFMVLDEALAELDAQGRQGLYRQLEQLRCQRGTTVITIEKNLEELMSLDEGEDEEAVQENLLDEVVVLKDGCLIFQGRPEDFLPNIPLVREAGVKPLPVCLLGWELYRRGQIPLTDIPITLSAARGLLSRLAAEGGDTLDFRRKEKGAVSVKTEGEVILRTENLAYYYEREKRLALQGIDLSLRRGEFIALVGVNGSGKTTLAKHFNGLLKGKEGTVYLNGTDVKEMRPEDLFRQVGYVFQNPDHQIFASKVEDEISYGLKNMGLTLAEKEKRMEEVLALTGLTDCRTKHPHMLSKGRRQMVALASVLVLKPEVLVIDEPTTGLDWPGVTQVMGMVQELHKQGTTVVMVSHDMDIVAHYAERVVVMKEGRCLAAESTGAFFSDPGLWERAGLCFPQSEKLAAWLGRNCARPGEWAKELRWLMFEGEQ